MPPIFHLDESMLLLEVVWSEVENYLLLSLSLSTKEDMVRIERSAAVGLVSVWSSPGAIKNKSVTLTSNAIKISIKCDPNFLIFLFLFALKMCHNRHGHGLRCTAPYTTTLLRTLTWNISPWDEPISSEWTLGCVSHKVDNTLPAMRQLPPKEYKVISVRSFDQSALYALFDFKNSSLRHTIPFR